MGDLRSGHIYRAGGDCITFPLCIQNALTGRNIMKLIAVVAVAVLRHRPVEIAELDIQYVQRHSLKVQLDIHMINVDAG
ncbi:hypothetical protein D3C80_1852960 [compost metagenome]